MQLLKTFLSWKLPLIFLHSTIFIKLHLMKNKVKEYRENLHSTIFIKLLITQFLE